MNEATHNMKIAYPDRWIALTLVHFSNPQECHPPARVQRYRRRAKIVARRRYITIGAPILWGYGSTRS
jgi:hypothetical protein